MTLYCLENHDRGESPAHAQYRDKCLPSSFEPLLVKSVAVELWVKGLTAVHWGGGDDLGNVDGELGREEPTERAWYQASSHCGVGTARACVTGGCSKTL